MAILDRLRINLPMRGEGLQQDHKALKEYPDHRDHKVRWGYQDLRELWAQPARKVLRVQPDHLELLVQRERSVRKARRASREPRALPVPQVHKGRKGNPGSASREHGRASTVMFKTMPSFMREAPTWHWQQAKELTLM
jgi:hypothetical protein